MLIIIAVGTCGMGVLLAGLGLLLRKPVHGNIPPRLPSLVVIAVGVSMVGVALWGNKNPKRFDRMLRPGTATGCPQILGHTEMFELTQEKAVSFSGARTADAQCEYNFEVRSGKKYRGKVNLELGEHEEEWNALCGVHPLTQGYAEVWLRKLPEDAQLVCFVTKTIQGAVWLDKAADGLAWQRLLQRKLPAVVD
jgi:hypothetical protein